MKSQNLNNSKFSTNFLLTQLSTLLFYLSILAFIIAFKFTDTPLVGNWYQQFMPNLGGQQINDIFFLDSLIGYAVASRNVNPDTASILKTTNSGDNWQVIFTQSPRRFSRIKFINQNTGFICGGTGSGTSYLYKSINSGNNWSPVTVPGNDFYSDMSVLDDNTIWLVDDDGLLGGVFFTSNGGASWQQQVNLFGGNPDRIYMFNARIGFISRTSSTQLYKTTNSGQNWNAITGIGTGSFNDMYFIDSLTGWKCKTVGGGGWLMGKTTDGGFNWVEQILPFGGNISSGSGITRFDNINKDTIWAVGGYLFYPGQGSRTFLYRTTNTGDTWYLQIPDTSFQIPNLSFIDFVDKFKGWAYRVGPNGIHTTTGGDTTFYLPVKQISSNIPKEFKLYQNYPNPFNPKTKIKYEIKPIGKSEKAKIKVIVYDVTGKQITELVNEQQSPGTYEIGFDASVYSSGVYFYSLMIDGILIDTKKMILIK